MASQEGDPCCRWAAVRVEGFWLLEPLDEHAAGDVTKLKSGGPEMAPVTRLPQDSVRSSASIQADRSTERRVLPAVTLFSAPL